ncbi:MAG: tRNA lysidine(34) synthetase TilS [Acinetobacter populi]|jgi:tRNA(Ile)-lysidine synthase|uniref:tRNA lysidine(34) synthetase TilS n=1 Tax=Acinetobacter populi TaxID=1582270 RepID=UPI0023573102|nr:tRNA lysidine(34) synthetase TilS [Acinetobacter populi]MCH4246301.1 tRNA lysidine(34) synthetase TilS [Acinetobacter populi]
MRSTLPTFNEVWQRKFSQRLLSHLQQFDPQAKIVLGCSGGMDSMLLLYLLAELIPQRLYVLSVDHQLQQASAAWSDFVLHHCQKLNIPCQIIPIQIQAGNLEAQARQARYAAFLQHLNPQDILVLAHHQQDQAETVLLRLLQGTGVSGLSAMQEIEWRKLHHHNLSQHDPFQSNLSQSGLVSDFSLSHDNNLNPHSASQLDTAQYALWRPLLTLSRQQIGQWIQQLNIQYVDDPMNHDKHYDRVWCREQLWPLLEQRFPRMQEGIARCATLMQDADSILYEVLQQDLKQCVDSQQRLNIECLNQLSLPRQRQLLSVWMQGEDSYRPPFAMVERIRTEVIAARQDAQSVLHHASYDFVRFDGYLYRYPQAVWQALQTTPQQQTLCFDVTVQHQIALGDVKVEMVSFGIDRALLSKTLTLVARQGGEKIAFYGRKGHRILKKELQERKIPPWFRHQTQILMYHNTILGVFTSTGFWLAESVYCGKDGWLPNLQLH